MREGEPAESHRRWCASPIINKNSRPGASMRRRRLFKRESLHADRFLLWVACPRSRRHAHAKRISILASVGMLVLRESMPPTIDVLQEQRLEARDLLPRSPLRLPPCPAQYGPIEGGLLSKKIARTTQCVVRISRLSNRRARVEVVVLVARRAATAERAARATRRGARAAIAAAAV